MSSNPPILKSSNFREPAAEALAFRYKDLSGICKKPSENVSEMCQKCVGNVSEMCGGDRLITGGDGY